MLKASSSVQNPDTPHKAKRLAFLRAFFGMWRVWMGEAGDFKQVNNLTCSG